MKAYRYFSLLSSLCSKSSIRPTESVAIFRLRAVGIHGDAVAEENHDIADFDSNEFLLPEATSHKPVQPTWDESYREKVDRTIFGVDKPRGLIKEEERKLHTDLLSDALMKAALCTPNEEGEEEDDAVSVDVEDQKSLSVGITGAPNAGKSSLTNCIVGSKVAAVSRKTNTTSHEVLGVLTEGNTQICFFDTPGLIMKKRGLPYTDIRIRARSVWSSLKLYDVLIVVFDVERHLNRVDSRVVRLIKSMGAKSNPTQKRVLCINKIDLIEKKKDLVQVLDEFKDLPGYERFFVISGLKGLGVDDLKQYLLEQAVKRPWDEDPETSAEDNMKNTSLEIVRERLLHHVHQEIPYLIEHRLVGWKQLQDGSLRIEQHLITPKESQRKILVGKNGSKIGRIGVEANEELRGLWKRHVHLILQVKLLK